MNILMVAAEVAPFAKTGGLADVAGALPRYLAALGHDVRVVTPWHASTDRFADDLQHVTDIPVALGPVGDEVARVHEGRLPGSDVPTYFLAHEGYFARHHPYTDLNGHGYLDNDRRFVFLSRGALDLCAAIGFAPDVVHVNDWHTAAIPVLLNTTHAADACLGGAASLLTIHNLQHQGCFYPGLVDVMGVGWGEFHPGSLEFHGQVNLMKGGLYHATLINAVSPGYADEIRTPAFGHGLDGVVRERGGDVRGILNGTDYDEWNPSADAHLPATYDADDLAGKAICKQALQGEMGLPQADVPLIGWVSRLVHQKGIDILAEAADRILGLDLQVVLLGTGETWAHGYFSELARRRPDRFACRIGYDEGMAHRIEAGSDFFLMPSRFEPCGLNQLYSLRYGTLPIVHAVGGLDDTVENFDERTLRGTGFKFHDLSADTLFDAVGWATHTWYNRKDAMAELIQRAMSRRFSWEVAARAYDALYREAVARRGR